MEVTLNNLSELIDLVRKKAGVKVPAWKCVCIYYKICLPSMTTPFSAHCLALYHSIGGFKNETFDSYCRMPAILVDAFRVIQREYDRINKIRKDPKKAAEEAAIAKLGL